MQAGLLPFQRIAIAKQDRARVRGDEKGSPKEVQLSSAVVILGAKGDRYDDNAVTCGTAEGSADNSNRSGIEVREGHYGGAECAAG